MKKVFKITGWVLLTVIVLAGIVYLWAWKSPKYYTVKTAYNKQDSIVPFRDYHLIEKHARPYIITGKDYTIFGATHTRNPQHPEINSIKEKWQQLKPTIALVEGRLNFLLPGLMNPVEKLGEAGLVKQLAKIEGIPVYNWDLSKEALAQQLQNDFSAEQVALAQILNPYFSRLRFGKPSSPEKYIKKYLKRAAYVGQEKNFQSVADVDRVWKKYFPAGRNWRETSDETALPGYLAHMMACTNDLRNQQLVAAVKELLAGNEKVFVICGSSHAACVQPAIK